MNLPKLPHALRAAYSFALIAFVVAGCEDSNEPDAAVGTYFATSLVTTENGQTVNQIANGSTITLSLAPGGFSSGIMHFEGTGGDPDIDANLNGTWTRSGSIVSVDTDADTFFPDMPLTFNGATLTGDETFTGGRVQVTLTRGVDID